MQWEFSKMGRCGHCFPNWQRNPFLVLQFQRQAVFWETYFEEHRFKEILWWIFSKLMCLPFFPLHPSGILNILFTEVQVSLERGCSLLKPLRSGVPRHVGADAFSHRSLLEFFLPESPRHLENGFSCQPQAQGGLLCGWAYHSAGGHGVEEGTNNL